MLSVAARGDNARINSIDPMSTHAVILASDPLPVPPRDAAWRVIRSTLRSGLFVSACAAALGFETSLIAGVAPQPARFYAFIFFATWASYRTHSLRRRPGLSAATVATTRGVFVVAAALLALLPAAMWPAIALLALLAWGYSRPALPGLPRFREFGVAKILILSAVWTVTTTYLPLVDRAIGAGPLALLLVRRFLFLFALCVAFDIRDHLADARAGIRTLPVRLGVSRCYALARLTLLAFAILVFFGPAVSRGRAAGPIELALLVSAIATWFAIEFSRRAARSTWYYLGFIDGMMLLQAALVWTMLWTTGR